MKIDISLVSLIVALLGFGVNIIVQITKEFMPIPTKLWTIIVSASLCIICYISGVSEGFFEAGISGALGCIVSSFFIAYCAMYGFDTFSELFERFKGGENINDDN